ncbi:MAG: hypothetical protein WEA04_01010 [Candidatus Andersenbacteria bacterium]
MTEEFDERTQRLLDEVDQQAQGAFGQKNLIRGYKPIIKSNYHVTQAIKYFSASTAKTEQKMTWLAGAQVILAVAQVILAIVTFWK